MMQNHIKIGGDAGGFARANIENLYTTDIPEKRYMEEVTED